MQLIQVLLGIRLKQFWRILEDVGFLRILLVIPFTLVLVVGVGEFLMSTKPYVLGGLLVGGLLYIHLSRKDAKVFALLNVPLYQLFWVEYAVLLIPIGLLLVWLGKWEAVVGLYVGIIPIGLVETGRLRLKRNSPWIRLGWLADGMYEWRYGLRRYGLLLGLFWLAGLGGGMFMPIAPICFLICMLLLPAFFDVMEPKEMMEEVELRHGLLRYKALWSLGYIYLAFLPHSVLFLWLHTAYWFVWLYAWVMGGTIVLFAVGYKYANWYPGRKRMNASLPMGLFAGCALFPPFCLAAFIILFIYWRKASSNISTYVAYS